MGENCAFHEKLEGRVSDVEDDIANLKTKQLLDTQKVRYAIREYYESNI